MANPNSRTRVGLGAGGGGGFSGPVLGPAQNTFGDSSTTDRAAAEALRNTYQAANPAWLAQYNKDTDIIILLEWTGDEKLYQRRDLTGSSWEDVNFIIGIPGRAGAGIQNGTAQLKELRWDQAAGEWQAINPIVDSYLAFTRENTVASLIAAFNDVASEPNGLGDATASQLKSASSGGVSASNSSVVGGLLVDSLWPVGGTAPYAWIILPEYHDWLDDFTASEVLEDFGPPYVGFLVNVKGLPITRQPWQLLIDGVPYDVGVRQFSNARPTDTSVMRISFTYAPPAATSRVVAQR